MKKFLMSLFAVFVIILSAVLYKTSAAFRNNAVSAEVSYIIDVSYIETVSIVEPESADRFITVPSLCQYPELPTGCEATAASMVLQFFGEEVSPEWFASTWLECSEDFYTYGGIAYGPDPNKVFAGDPFSEHSYGCFASPIADAVNRNSRICEAEVITGKSLEYLCGEFIDDGMPLLIWATMGMKPSYKGKSWITPDGDSFTWTACEHCLVLVGYNDRFYFFNDPQSGTAVAYEKALAEQRFAELGMQAVYIKPAFG